MTGDLIAGAGIPLMAAGGGAGVVTVWDLEARKLHTIIRDAHDAPVTKLHFFPGEPRLMSAGAVSTFHMPVSASVLSVHCTRSDACNATPHYPDVFPTKISKELSSGSFHLAPS